MGLFDKRSSEQKEFDKAYKAALSRPGTKTFPALEAACEKYKPGWKGWLLKRLMHLLILTAACICILHPMKPVRAASYQCLNVSGGKATAGGTTFYKSNKSLKAVKGGKTVTLLSAPSNGWVSGIVVTNGTTAFAATSETKGKGYSSYSVFTVYQIKVSTQKKTKLFSVKSPEGLELCGYYGGKLLYVRGTDPGALWCYRLSSKTNKKIASNVTSAEQYGKYFYLTPYRGNWMPYQLRVYNAATGKVRQISKTQVIYYIGKTRIYYVEAKQTKSSSVYDVCVKSCRLDGTGKKTLTKQFKLRGARALTEHSFKYLPVNQSTYKTITF